MSRIWQDRVMFWLLVASLLGVILQITMGSTVRVTGSGDGCPDWPTCFGSWIPPFEYHALMEYSHRTIGVIVGLIIIAATLRVWLRHRNELPIAVSVSAALVAVSIAGIVGGAVVLSELDPGLRTLHLMLAESVAILLAHATVASLFTARGHPAQSQDEDGERAVPRSLIWISSIAAGLTLVALLSGSYAVWRGAGTVCPAWPLCGGMTIIPNTELAWIHMSHRFFAILAAVPSLWAGHAAMRFTGIGGVASATIRIAGLAVVVLVTAQILLGAANPWSSFQQWARVSHLTFATLQWVSLICLTLLLTRPFWRREAEASASDTDSHEWEGRGVSVTGS